MKYDVKWKSAFRRRLLNWFRRNARDLPWRRKKTPYRIWVSEIMLQQTQVATVVEYYRRFLRRFPNVKALAAAEQADVLKLWEGLGYYRRARQMHAAAQQIVERHHGVFPSDFESVLALPGIGRYSAGAILSISQDQRLPILEGNTIRLFARLLEMIDDPRLSANQKLLWQFSDDILPRKDCGDFNQALMELGSEICQPQNPVCVRCPVKNLCPTFVKGLQAVIPAPSRKLNYEAIDEAVVLVKRRGKYLVRLCRAGERWAGLWDFPRFKLLEPGYEVRLETLKRELKCLTGLSTEISSCDHQIKHAVTRFKITLHCFQAKTVSGRLKSLKELSWKTKSELEELAMSTTGRKITKKIAYNNKNPKTYWNKL